MTDTQSLIHQLASIRQQRRISQTTIARRMGTRKSAISRLESNTDRTPYLSTVLRYADALGVTIGITSVTPKNGVEQVKSTGNRPLEEQQ